MLNLIKIKIKIFLFMQIYTCVHLYIYMHTYMCTTYKTTCITIRYTVSLRDNIYRKKKFSPCPSPVVA